MSHKCQEAVQAAEVDGPHQPFLPAGAGGAATDEELTRADLFVIIHYFLLIFISTCPTFQRFSFMNVFVSESQTPPPVRIQNNSIKDHGSWVPYAHLTAM